MSGDKSLKRNAESSETQPLLGSNTQPNRFKRALRDVDRGKYNTFVMGFGFLLLFSAFSPGQSFLTTLYSELGFVALAVLYFSWCFSSTFMPPIVQKVTPRRGMQIAAVSYCLWVASTIFRNSILIIIASVLCGLSSGLMWTSQGSFLTQNSNKHNIGSRSGIFFAFFIGSLLLGNFLAEWLVLAGFSDGQFLAVLTSIGLIGFLVLLLLREPFTEYELKSVNVTTENEDIQQALGVFGLIKTSPIILFMVPLFMYSGWSQTYFYGMVPPHVGRSTVGLLMAVFGTADATGSLTAGWLYLLCLIFSYLRFRVGQSIVIFMAGGLSIFGAILVNIGTVVWTQYKIHMIFAGMVCIGLSDGGFNTQIYSVLGVIEPNNSNAAFSVFRIAQTLIMGASFLIGPFWTINGESITSICLSFVGCLVYAIKVRPVVEKHRKDRDKA